MFPIKEVSRGALAFGEYGAKFAELVPPRDSIPEEFSMYGGSSERNPWVKLQSDWFFKGLVGYSFIPKEGVDPEKAFEHLGAIQGSWEPQHEDKVAYVSFLMSEWFEDVVGPDGKSVITGKKVKIKK